MKEKFVEIDKIMDKLELNTNVERASEFLNCQVEITFYGILSSLGRV